MSPLSSTPPTLAIVGASYAGVQLAASARDAGFGGRILMFGDEPHLPYQRPPLSKGLLTGKTTVAALALKSADFYREARIEHVPDMRVSHIDPAAHRLTLADGSTLAWDWLALATGARCRALPMPGAGLQGVHALRSLDDALALDEAAHKGKRVCVIGGGFIGLEVAAALAGRGLEVTVVELGSRLLSRAVTPEISRFVASLHAAHDVRVLCNSAVQAIHGHAGKVSAVELESGECLGCDLVVAGIGVVPNDELARAAGIVCANGIVTDALGRTSAPGVLAIGDCAATPNPHAAEPDTPLRLESIQVANDLARAAASLIAGQPQACIAVPWFWSDQYDAKLQMAGLMSPTDDVVVRGDPASGRFSVFCLRDGCIAAVQTVSRPADHMLGRKLVAARTAIAADTLADPDFDPRTLIPR